MNSATLENTLSAGEIKRLQRFGIPLETKLEQLTWKELHDIFFILDHVQEDKIGDGNSAAAKAIGILTLRTIRSENVIFA
jgi:hypothetical protein